MAKQVKTFRIEDDILEAFDEYIKFISETFNINPTLSSIANEALAKYLSESIEGYYDICKSGHYGTVGKNGYIEHHLTPAQIKEGERLFEKWGELGIKYELMNEGE